MGVVTFITKDEKQRGLFLIVGGILLVRTKSIQNIIQMKVTIYNIPTTMLVKCMAMSHHPMGPIVAP